MADVALSSRIVRRATKAGLRVPSRLAHKLQVYLELLVRWNRRMNLTALTADDRGIDRLIVEPLVAARRLPGNASSVVDIGSGGGSPAVPLKLAVPSVQLRMVESKTRKAAFLREVVRHLELGETEVETCRYEHLLTRPDLHEAADVVTVRGVRVDGRMLSTLHPLLRTGGAVFLFRSVGEEPPEQMPPPFVLEMTYPLVESLSSGLVVLKKSE